MTYGAAPVLNGTTLPRPNGAPEEPTQVGQDVTLAAGKIIRYDRGVRQSITYTWTKLTEAELATIRAAYTRGACSLRGVDGILRVVLCSPPKVTPIAGTSPVRFDVELAVVEQTPSES